MRRGEVWLAEVALDPDQAGLDRPSVVNCDGMHTVEQSSLDGPVGAVSREMLDEVCSAVAYALGC